MGNTNKGHFYMESYIIDNTVVGKHASANRKPFMIAALAAAIISLLMIPLMVFSTSASASWVDDTFCGNDLGGNTQYSNVNDSLDTNDIMSSGGKYSVMDLYQNSVVWTTYNGNTGGDGLSNFNLKDLRGVTTSGASKTNVTNAGTASRTAGSCIGNFFGSGLANIFLRISGLVVKFMSIFVTYAVNPDIICQNPSNPSGNCINLVGIIGGTGGSNGGIIGTLYSGLYLSLAAIVVVIAALWALTKIIKGSFRESIFGIVWAFIAVLLGIMALSNPMLLAEAPMKASVTIGSCVTEALNGRACLSGSSTRSTSNNDTNTICLIDPNKSIDADQHLAIDARMATCKIWKAFVLEPWTEGQFGMSFESLNTSNADLITKSPSSKSLDYWKKIKTSMTGSSLNDLCTLKSGTTYSNIALYQLDLMTNIHDCSGAGGGDYHSTAKTAGDSDVYNDWYYVVDIMSQAKADTGTGADNVSQSWNIWSGSSSSTRTNLGLVAIVAAIMAATIIIPSSIYAIGYLFMGTILTVFAPMFMLAGIHPTVGRKIFLGWLELEVGAIMKYFFMVLWVYIVVEIYGAILGSSTSSATTLVFIIAMTTTLKAYRKELLEVFGNVDMGGKKLSNSMSGRFNKAMGKANGLKNAALGGAMSGFVNGDGNIMKRFRSAKDMAGYQVMQQGKYMGGFTGNAFMAGDKIFDQRRKKMVAEADRQNAAADDMLNNAHSASQAAIGQTNIEADQGFTGFDISDPDAQSKLDSYYHNSLINIRSDERYKGITNVDNARKMAIADWDRKVNSAVKDGNVVKGKDGIFRTAPGAAGDKDSIEAAYRNNLKTQSELISGAKKVKDENGIYHYQFASDADEKKFNTISSLLNDDKALAAHQSWMNDAEQYGELAAEGEFSKVKAQGKLADGINTISDLYQRRDEMDESISDLKDKYGHTSAAIAANTEAQRLLANESDIASSVQHLKEVNSEVTDRTAGAMWSGKSARKLNERGASLDRAINEGGDAKGAMNNADYLTSRGRVLHKVGDVAGRAADSISDMTRPITQPIQEKASAVVHPFRKMSSMINGSLGIVNMNPQAPKGNPHYDSNGNYIG